MADPLTMGLMVASTVAGAFQSVMQGNAANASAKAQQAQLVSNAKAERATAQRNALEERRQGRLAQSRAVAVSAAQGGALDKTGIDIFQALGEEGIYRSGVAMAEGENRARGLEYQGQILRAEGKQAKRQGYLTAAGKLLEGGTSFFSTYGEDLFPKTTPSSAGRSATFNPNFGIYR